MMELSVILLLLLGHSAGALAAWTASDIRSLQGRLKENQFYSGPISGVLDRDMELAITKATADFPEVAKLKGDRREYFVAQILSWYNNAFELKAEGWRVGRIVEIGKPTDMIGIRFARCEEGIVTRLGTSQDIALVAYWMASSSCSRRGGTLNSTSCAGGRSRQSR